jgi:hypothetical protein
MVRVQNSGLDLHQTHFFIMNRYFGDGLSSITPVGYYLPPPPARIRENSTMIEKQLSVETSPRGMKTSNVF